MPTNEINQIDLMLDRRTLVDLRALAAEIIERIEAIQAKYPAGTFEDAEEQESTFAEPRPPKKRRSPVNKKLPLSEAILNHLKDHDSIDIHEFSRAHPHYKKQHMYGVLGGLAKRATPLVKQDPENRALYHRL